MQHQNKKITDMKRIRRLYEDGVFFTAFDTETTGISPSSCRIIEIGAVKFNKDGIIQTWNRLFYPEQQIPPFITQLTHITQAMVDVEDRISCHLPDFIDFLSDSVIIAHNAQFDLNFLNSECGRCNLPLSKNRFIDTLQLSRQKFPALQSHKLDYLADYLKIDKGSSHRAQDDANTCKKLFEFCLNYAVPFQGL